MNANESNSLLIFFFFLVESGIVAPQKNFLENGTAPHI